MSALIGFAGGLPGHPPSVQERSFAYAWLEAPLKACVARLGDVSDWQDLTVWPAGRVFGGESEYRWQWDGKTLHAVLLIDNGALPPEFAENSVTLQRDDDAALVLWGEWVDPEKDRASNPDGNTIFYANEIPGLQSYPIELSGQPADGHTPRLLIRRYRAVQEEKGEFSRCVEFSMQGREKED